jgi:hypothetical protein
LVRRAKREAGGAAGPSAARSPASGPPTPANTSGGAAAPAATSQDADDGPQLLLAWELAQRTSVLSYAASAGHLFRVCEEAQAKLQAAAAEQGRPLRLVLLGAAEDAEGADLRSWQARRRRAAESRP